MNPVHTLSPYLFIVDINMFLPFAIQFQTGLFNLGFQDVNIFASLTSRYMEYVFRSYILCKFLIYMWRIVTYTVM